MINKLEVSNYKSVQNSIISKKIYKKLRYLSEYLINLQEFLTLGECEESERNKIHDEINLRKFQFDVLYDLSPYRDEVYYILDHFKTEERTYNKTSQEIMERLTCDHNTVVKYIRSGKTLRGFYIKKVTVNKDFLDQFNFDEGELKYIA